MSDWFDQEDQGATANRKTAKRKRGDEPLTEEASNAEGEGFFGEESEETGEDGGIAQIERNSSRDAFYDGMDKVSNTIGAVAGMAGGAAYVSGNPAVGGAAAIAGGVAGGVFVGSMAGRGVGDAMDHLADLADDNAHRNHLKGDMKRIEGQKDEKALKRINKGMKPGQGVTKDD